MLNEIWEVHRSLDSQGITAKPTSKLFKKNKKDDGLKVYLSTDGFIKRVECLDAEVVSQLSRYELANGMGFPTFNLKALREFGETPHERKAALKELDARVKSIRRSAQPAAELTALIKKLLSEPEARDTRYLRDVETRLNRIPEEVAPFWASNDIPDDFSLIKRLIETLLTKSWQADDFLNNLESAICRYAEDLASGADFNALLTLYGVCFKSKSPLLLEILSSNDRCHAITSLKMADFLNRQLLKATSEEAKNSYDSSNLIVDSLSGVHGSLENIFPSPILPVLGKAILFSNPKEVACQSRYGLQEGLSFCTTIPTAQHLQDALKFITEDSRKGKTWDSVPADYGRKGSNLVVAYAERAPDELDLASLFASDSNEEGAFEERASSTLESLKTFEQKYQGSSVRLFVISKPDPGRCQVYLAQTLNKERIEKACRRWKSGCENIPKISTIMPYEERGRIHPPVLGPIAVLKTLNISFTRDGSYSVSVATASLREIYELFLVDEESLTKPSHPVHATIRRLFRAAVFQLEPLLRTFGAIKLSGDLKNLKPAARQSACDGCSLLGLLLFFQNRRQETYMSEESYNLGRLLQFADIIHQEYCYAVRNKGKANDTKRNLPQQLIGQSIFNSALIRASLAIDQLSRRIQPYEIWASNANPEEQTSNAKHVRRAKWALREFKKVLPTLREKLTKPLDEKDRAELFLGYLSDTNKEADSETEGEIA